MLSAEPHRQLALAGCPPPSPRLPLPDSSCPEISGLNSPVATVPSGLPGEEEGEAESLGRREVWGDIWSFRLRRWMATAAPCPEEACALA